MEGPGTGIAGLRPPTGPEVEDVGTMLPEEGPTTEGGRMESAPPLAEPPDPERSDAALTVGAGVGVEGGAGVVGAEWVAVDAGGY